MADIRCPLWVWHHPKDAAVCRQDASNILLRAVGVVGVATRDAVFGFKRGERRVVGKVVPVVVRDRDVDHIAGVVALGESAGRSFDPQPYRLADLVQTGIAQQRARQKASFGQHLKAVADAERISATFDVGL